MSGGLVFDLWALAFAATVAGITWLAFYLLARRGPKPRDWAKDWPEFKLAKDAHVRKLDW